MYGFLDRSGASPWADGFTFKLLAHNSSGFGRLRTMAGPMITSRDALLLSPGDP